MSPCHPMRPWPLGRLRRAEKGVGARCRRYRHHWHQLRVFLGQLRVILHWSKKLLLDYQVSFDVVIWRCDKIPSSTSAVRMHVMRRCNMSFVIERDFECAHAEMALCLVKLDHSMLGANSRMRSCCQSCLIPFLVMIGSL